MKDPDILVARFTKHLFTNWREPTPDWDIYYGLVELIGYLLRHELLKPTAMLAYCLYYEYLTLSYRMPPPFDKRIVHLLADYYNLTPDRVRYLLQHFEP